jgi:hypothetical protein
MRVDTLQTFVQILDSASLGYIVMEPDPQGSETFCRIRIRNSDVMDPDPKLDLNLTKNHPKNYQFVNYDIKNTLI